MRKINGRDDTYKNIMKVAKRISLTIACCIPFVIVFGYLTRKVITTNALQVVCFMLIMGVAVAVEEVIARRKEKKCY